LGSGSSLHVWSAEVSQIIIHEACGPDSVVDLHDADGPAGEDLAEASLRVGRVLRQREQARQVEAGRWVEQNEGTALPFLWNRHSADPDAWQF
jgi:hypothetical protein